MLTLLFILIAAACAVAVYRWQWGVFAAIVVGLLQDPLRKMVPGVPGYLSMCSVPVWGVTLVMALYTGQVTARRFLSGFPRLARWISIFAFYLCVPAALSFSYGKGTWQITVLGALVYMTSFFMLAIGWAFVGSRRSIRQLLSFYAIFTSVLLIGGPLDYFGLAKGWAAVGTEVMDKVWVTYRMGSEGVFMYAGFFRSPDVMGWHAAMVVMIACLLAVMTRGWMRWVWIVLAVWGFLNLWICGRRKMIAMLPIFGAIFLFLIFKFRSVTRAVPVVGTILLIVAAGWYGVSRVYQETSIDTYYGSTIGDLEGRVIGHGFGAVITTVKQAGVFGYGLGMGQQGVHHIQAEKPRLWQEGGPGKLVAELGVPGGILFLCVGGVLLWTAYSVVGVRAGSISFPTYAGLLALLGANAASAVVSAQIFGDLFILLFLAFLMGLLLSGGRNVSNELMERKLMEKEVER